MEQHVQLSRFISMILRHKPEAISISLDECGYARVSDLIDGIRESGRYIDPQILDEIVKTDSKGRYSFDESGTRIRANHGHTIQVNVPLKEREPPEFLFHGTTTKATEHIATEGIKKMNRVYVHLSEDYDTSFEVGSRRGEPVIVTVHARDMYEDGYKFYQSESGIWLTDYVPTDYLQSWEWNNEQVR